ncbi:MAG: SDR family oxidoreductase [Acidobacteriota bacterium]
MRILVMGGTGMLGHKVFQRLRERFADTRCTIRGSLLSSGPDSTGLFAPAAVVEHVDVLDWARVVTVLSEVRPDVVVNCVGIVKQRPDAKDAIPSITINALLPHRLAATLEGWGGRLIHISTDCIFSGERGHYTEIDLPDARDLYGRTKFLGEVSDGNTVTLRTSMIGRELSGHRSLLDWLLRQNGGAVRGYQRAFYSGLTTNELANVILGLIEEQPGLTGLYQVTGQTITKYDLLRLIVDTFGLDIRVDPETKFFCDRSLIGDKFRAATGYQSPAWPELIDALHADPTPYNDSARHV